MHGGPILFFDKSHPLLVLCILPKNKKILNVRSFNFVAISTQIPSNFSTNAGICDFQLYFGEANFTRRNDITSKNALNRPICVEMKK